MRIGGGPSQQARFSARALGGIKYMFERYTEKARRVIFFARSEPSQFGSPYIETEHLRLGLLREEKCFAGEILHERGLRLSTIREELARTSQEKAQPQRGQRESSLLSEFSRDLTQAAMDTQLDPLVGRDGEVERVVQILCRRTKNNPVLIGEPGVGKTAIVEGLAQRIADGEVPSFLADKRILALDLSLIVAGVTFADDGINFSVSDSTRYIPDRFLPDKAIDLIDEAGARVKLRQTSLPEELTEVQKRIKFIVHRMENAIANHEFEKARFYSDEERKERENLRALREKYHLDESSTGVVGREDIEDVVSRWTGVPITSIKEEESAKLLRIYEELHKRIISQDKSIVALARAIRRSPAGLKNPNRPIGSFLFLGPTGEG